MHEVHARIYPNDKRKRHLAHTVIRKVVGCYPFGYRLLSVQRQVVIRKVVGCHPFGYKLSSERIVAVICMDDIVGIDDYKERRTGEV